MRSKNETLVERSPALSTALSAALSTGLSAALSTALSTSIAVDLQPPALLLHMDGSAHPSAEVHRDVCSCADGSAQVGIRRPSNHERAALVRWIVPGEKAAKVRIAGLGARAAANPRAVATPYPSPLFHHAHHLCFAEDFDWEEAAAAHAWRAREMVFQSAIGNYTPRRRR